MSETLQKPRVRSQLSVWLLSSGLSVGILMIVLLLCVILWNGLAVFWPREVVLFKLNADSQSGPAGRTQFSAVILNQKAISDESGRKEYYLYVGNEEVLGDAFHYLPVDEVVSESKPKTLTVVERTTRGKALFEPLSFNAPDGKMHLASEPDFYLILMKALRSNKALRDEINYLENDVILPLSQSLTDALEASDQDRVTILEKSIQDKSRELSSLRQKSEAAVLSYRLPSGELREEKLSGIIDLYRPNEMNAFEKLGYFATHFWRFLSESPREGNTQGGIFPVIVGTFVLTLLMSALVMPLGVIAAVYLNEYAKSGPIVHGVRIAVSNLAGVPSIVYGVFGLGFFVYFLGGTIDSLFYTDRLPAPTFGTGGILWAALTLALLTVPVVIVATEESLLAFPQGMREASQACGASHWQTLWRVVLPASVPGMLTGLILAIARAAGEVAPLMLVGVIAFAPDLPFDSEAPWFHLDRKFMHMGYHIYSLGFLTPDSEAAMPMVYATTLLLILIVVMLNVGAIFLRDYMRRRYTGELF